MTILYELQPNVFIVDKLPGETECITLSAEKGVVYACDYCVTWIRNNQDVRRFLLQSEQQKVELSRLAVARLCEMDLCKLPFTYPALARLVSGWLGLDQKSALPPDHFLPNWHYQHCEPCKLRYAYLNDMRAAYWQIACKAPSLLCRIDYEKERVIWLSMTNQSEEKWERCKKELEPYKKLRLSIIGVNSTGLRRSSESTAFFAKGRRRPPPGYPPTNFRALALLTVRCAYEITQLQVRELRAWYSVADCVISESKSCPYWDSLGIAYRIKAKGAVETYGLGQWKVGKDSTEPYKWKRASIESGKPAVFEQTFGKNLERPIYHEQLYH